MVAFGINQDPNENKINEYIQKVSSEKENLKLEKKKKKYKKIEDNDSQFFITEKNNKLNDEVNDNNNNIDNNNDNINDN